MDSLYRSVELYCDEQEIKIPPEIQKIGRWVKNRGNSSFDVGISILGSGGNFGRQVELPTINDVSFEGVGDAIQCIADELVTKLGFDGGIIVLDNIENLNEDTLRQSPISFRDTIFTIPNIWWVLIGQSGLGSLVKTLEPKVFERIQGSGIEIKPVSLEELDEAINRRVLRFHNTQEGKSPLPKSVHKTLFESSYGEMRFVFKYSNTICQHFVQKIRASVIKELDTMELGLDFREVFDRYVDNALGKRLVEHQIEHDVAISILETIIKTEIDGLNLRDKEKRILRKIGDNDKVRAKNYAEFSIKSMQDFSSNYLSKYWQQNLLIREQEGRAVYYKLRGIAKLAYDRNLF